MKRAITIVIIVLAVVGGGYYLFKISGQNPTGNAQTVIDYSKAQKVDAPRPVEADDHVQGDPNAKNVFIAYEDFQCPYCAEYSKTVTGRVATELKDTKFVFRNYPLETVHKNGITASLAAESAGAQGKYWEMHDMLFGKQGEWSGLADPLPKFAEYAQQVGVANIEQFKSDVQSKKYMDKVSRDALEAVGLGVTGTPTYYFNGVKLRTSGNLEDIKSQVQNLYEQ